MRDRDRKLGELALKKQLPAQGHNAHKHTHIRHRAHLQHNNFSLCISVCELAWQHKQNKGGSSLPQPLCVPAE